MALNLGDMKFDNTLGALLVGGLCATALFGVTCVQMYTYFMTGSKDNIMFKSTIAFLWVLDTFDAVLNGHILYFYLVSNYLNPIALAKLVWSIMVHVAATSVANFIIRAMFVHRVFFLSGRNLWITILILAASTSDLVVGLVITAKAFVLVDFDKIESLSTLFYVNFASGTGADILVALSLTYYLRKSRTGFKRTDSLVWSLMTYTINTGLLVAIDAGVGLILYTVMPQNFIFLTPYLLLSKLYLNSYLAVLNARDGLRKTMDDPVSIHLSNVSGSSSRRFPGSEFTKGAMNGGSSEKTPPGNMSISVSTLIDRRVDGAAPSGRNPKLR